MPIRSTLAYRRARYTGEPAPLARRGVGRDRTHGLDTCSPAQLELRALLFYFAFTHGSWNLARMLFYTWDASPQHDLFVMANVTAPENLAQTIGAKRYDRPGLPGLRLLPNAGAGNYDFVHLPTGGRLRILTVGEGWYGDVAALHLGPLSEDESAALAAAASMSDDTKRLFAALLAGQVQLPHQGPSVGRGAVLLRHRPRVRGAARNGRRGTFRADGVW